MLALRKVLHMTSIQSLLDVCLFHARFVQSLLDVCRSQWSSHSQALRSNRNMKILVLRQNKLVCLSMIMFNYFIISRAVLELLP